MTGVEITAKGTRTRKLILETAIDLFRKQGYEATTVREIAKTAGIAVGNAYYYFRSKEELILSLYERLSDEQAQLVHKSLVKRAPLKDRIVDTIRCKLAITQAHRDLFISLFCVAARPGSPLSPFSETTKRVRDKSISSFREAVEGSEGFIAPEIKQVLPTLLWLYYMAIVFYWLHDTSSLNHRTHELLDCTAQMIAFLVSVSSLPLMTPFRNTVLKLLEQLQISF